MRIAQVPLGSFLLLLVDVGDNVIRRRILMSPSQRSHLSKKKKVPEAKKEAKWRTLMPREKDGNTFWGLNKKWHSSFDTNIRKPAHLWKKYSQASVKTSDFPQLPGKKKRIRYIFSSNPFFRDVTRDEYSETTKKAIRAENGSTVFYDLFHFDASDDNPSCFKLHANQPNCNWSCNKTIKKALQITDFFSPTVRLLFPQASVEKKEGKKTCGMQKKHAKQRTWPEDIDVA